MEREAKKVHRTPKSGPKAEKKKKKDLQKKGVTPEQHLEDRKRNNRKAFSWNSGARATAAIKKQMELKEKGLHAPIAKKEFDTPPPPVVVSVVGPPKVRSR